ncbi:hypothetical protein NDN01_17075 [Sphingomonas sp. QA11]|uniref:hypothetical protein n=1 Tax=Sphingomonas sp. QA11 TaxID=2950605 RepID=UPI00234A53E3|nr:hypothetical protein [Sphingomonas sp. QA11]WCM25741.1 hypothetical protein NDN01_17075 [Sphingomonas sp. QA11]
MKADTARSGKGSRRRGQAKKWVGYRIYAAMRSNGEGWSFVRFLGECEPIDQDLAALSLLPDTRIEISRGVTSLTHEPLEILDFGDAFELACGTGWSHDYRAECWRAPDEALVRPPPGPDVEQVDVVFQQPYAGGISVRFTAGGQSFESQLTNLDDRLPALVRWLEQVAAGTSQRFCYDIEGSEIEFHLWPHGESRHLLIAHNTRIGRYEEINVAIPREALVRSIYLPLITYWESPAFIDNWREWATYAEAEDIEVDEHEYELCPYELRSPVLDHFLLGQ